MDKINEKLNEFKVPLGLLLVGGVLLVGGFFSSDLVKRDEKSIEIPKESIVSDSQLNEIKIDVAGAVNSPGVFTLNKESRIEDAVRMAGGFSENVSREFVAKSLNLSQKVVDGQKLYIPFEGETTGITTTTGTTKTAGSQVAGVSNTGKSTSLQSKVGLNSAGQAQLEELPGIGPVTAKKIIENRPYESLEQLLEKKAVSKKVYSEILELVDLN